MAHNLNDYWIVSTALDYSDGAAAYVIAEIPAKTFVDNVVLVVTTAFVGTSPTLDVGDEDNDDTFVDNTDVTATTAAAYTARAGASADCTLKQGAYYSAKKNVLGTIGGTSLTAGEAYVLLHCVNLSDSV